MKIEVGKCYIDPVDKDIVRAEYLIVYPQRGLVVTFRVVADPKGLWYGIKGDLTFGKFDFLSRYVRLTEMEEAMFLYTALTCVGKIK